MNTQEDMWRPRYGPPRAARRLGPLLIGTIQVAGTYFASHHQSGGRHLDALAILLLAAGPAALVMKRRYPATVLGLVLAITLAYTLRDYPHGPIFLALIVAFITAVLRGRRVAALVSLVVGYFSFLWLGYLTGTESRPT